MNEERIRKGIEYFRGIKPSSFNAAHALHLKYFLDLVEEHLDKRDPDLYETAQQIFKA